MADSKLTTQRKEAHEKKAVSDVCSPCQNDNTVIPAKTWCDDCNEFLCMACSRYHRKLTALQHHRLVPVNEMESHKKVNQVVHKCNAHKEMHLKYFCEDHEQLFCSECFVNIHRTCSKIVCIPDVATQEFEKFEELENTLCELEERFKIQQRTVKEKKELVLRKNGEACTQIDNFGAGLISVIERLVKDAKIKTSTIKREDLDRIQSQEKVLSDAAASLKDCKEAIESGKGDEIQLFVVMKRVQKVIKTLAPQLEETQILNSVRELDFVGSCTLATFLDSARVLGSLVDKDLHNLEQNEDGKLKMYEVRRFKKTSPQAIWVRNHPTCANELRVSSNKNTRLIYVLLFSFGNVRPDVTLDIQEGGTGLVYRTISYETTTSEVFRMAVVRKDGMHGLLMRTGQTYRIAIRLSYRGNSPSGFTRVCGQDIRETVTSKGVTFSLSGGESADNGLIAGFIFTF